MKTTIAALAAAVLLLTGCEPAVAAADPATVTAAPTAATDPATVTVTVTAAGPGRPPMRGSGAS